MSSVGIDRKTWLPLVGWNHVRQSIEVILTTELGERVYRRRFGSNVPDLIDKPQNLETIMDLYMAVAEALEARIDDGFQLGEPRFQLTNIVLVPAPDGHVVIEAHGDYYPRGHLGDFTRPVRDQLIAVPVGVF